MPYTPEQQREFARKFAVAKRRQIIGMMLYAPFMAFLFILASTAEQTGSIAFGIPLFLFWSVFVGALLGMLIFTLYNWRCPACHEYLGRKHLNPRYCPACGTQLQR